MPQVNGTAAVDSWYGEIKDYPNYTNPQLSMSLFEKIGHFTQLVWKGTREVCFGVARGKTWTYVVANYYPAGNIWSNASFVANCLKPSP